MSDTETNQVVTGVILSITALVEHLHKAGVADKQQYIEALMSYADAVRTFAPDRELIPQPMYLLNHLLGGDPPGPYGENNDTADTGKAEKSSARKRPDWLKILDGRKL